MVPGPTSLGQVTVPVGASSARKKVDGASPDASEPPSSEKEPTFASSVTLSNSPLNTHRQLSDAPASGPESDRALQLKIALPGVVDP